MKERREIRQLQENLNKVKNNFWIKDKKVKVENFNLH